MCPRRRSTSALAPGDDQGDGEGLATPLVDCPGHGTKAHGEACRASSSRGRQRRPGLRPSARGPLTSRACSAGVRSRPPSAVVTSVRPARPRGTAEPPGRGRRLGTPADHTHRATAKRVPPRLLAEPSTASPRIPEQAPDPRRSRSSASASPPSRRRCPSAAPRPRRRRPALFRLGVPGRGRRPCCSANYLHRRVVVPRGQRSGVHPVAAVTRRGAPTSAGGRAPGTPSRCYCQRFGPVPGGEDPVDHAPGPPARRGVSTPSGGVVHLAVPRHHHHTHTSTGRHRRDDHGRCGFEAMSSGSPQSVASRSSGSLRQPLTPGQAGGPGMVPPRIPAERVCAWRRTATATSWPGGKHTEVSRSDKKATSQGRTSIFGGPRQSLQQPPRRRLCARHCRPCP